MTVPPDVSPGPGRWRLEGTSLDDLSLVAGSFLIGKDCGAHFWIVDGRTTPTRR